ncbi:MAG: hypothetical protein KIT84_26880 [Labilithrix sp.]|nr:hypothetical protein [Labilithrix sp.]MCW5814680.1 hypothetical protein [Labilithrix sp.]
MKCAVHADRPATHSIGDSPACEGCAEAAEARAKAVAPALPLLVSIAYLAVLAIGYVMLRGRPIVGGIAAVAALFVGRGLQLFFLRPVAPLRTSEK